ncbi:MAG: ribbon-helix-helix domain-containing protein [Oligoflexia bacterium]|nr:ribbon-helix-helix domain-containing protein [Oligoflexia bacterium]
MMSKKVATTIYITEKQQDQLKELNDRLKVPVSELIRQGIDLIVKKYDENLSGQISLFEEKDQKTQ